MIFFIVLIALWTFPVITLLLFFLTKNKLSLRNNILKISVGLMVITVVGLFTNISTTSQKLDWILLTSIYFTICFVLWILVWQKYLIVKIITILIMIVVFGIGYLSSTIGIIGVGFVIGAYEPCEEKWLNDGLIYKEIGIGNAISDYRGKRVEIYKTISWLPLIEWKIKSKDYYDIITYTNQLSVNYKKAENKIYLSTSGYSQNEQKWITWNDVISLE